MRSTWPRFGVELPGSERTGNVPVPFLFSKAVNLHPITIIVAVLVFGGIWGFWGVFFAIPLATLVKAVYNAWPNQDAERPLTENAQG